MSHENQEEREREREGERERERVQQSSDKRGMAKKVHFLHLTLFQKGKPPPLHLEISVSPISSSNLGLSSTQILLPNSNAFLGFF